jgi:hypothetical protein
MFRNIYVFVQTLISQEVIDIIPQPIAFAAPAAFPPRIEALEASDSFDAPQNNRVFASDRFDGVTTAASKLSGGFVSGVEKPTVEIRNYFPETWLFDLVQILLDFLLP